MMSMNEWAIPSRPISIKENEVHAWRICLALPPARIDYLTEFLDPIERRRASRFRFPVHRDRFIARRGTLRMLLGEYLGVQPSRIGFACTEYGKPALKYRRKIDLRFNLSHTEDMALVAIACGREVGVDIERIQPALAEASVPERFFTALETIAIRELPHQEQIAAFFECWVRKEAYVKAKGTGLAAALNSFDVSNSMSKAPGVRCTFADPADHTHWTIEGVRPAPDYTAALVVEGSSTFTLRSFSWDYAIGSSLGQSSHTVPQP